MNFQIHMKSCTMQDSSTARTQDPVVRINRKQRAKRSISARGVKLPAPLKSTAMCWRDQKVSPHSRALSRSKTLNRCARSIARQDIMQHQSINATTGVVMNAPLPYYRRTHPAASSPVRPTLSRCELQRIVAEMID